MVGQQGVWAKDISATRAGRLGDSVGRQSINIIDTVMVWYGMVY